MAELSRNGRDVTEEALQLLNAYQMPRLGYDSMRRTFSLVNDKKSLIGEASDKVDMFAQRYSLIHQRILRQDIFQPKLVGGGGGTHVLTPIESLLGRTGRKFLLGMIVQVSLWLTAKNAMTSFFLNVTIIWGNQVEEGKYYLEDHTAQVLLDFSQASLLTDGFVTENSIVLVEGEAVDGVLQVLNIGRLLGFLFGV